MTHIDLGMAGSAGAASSLPDGAIGAVARSTARIGLVQRDGLISTFSRRLARDLGFDAPEDLRGLVYSSLWHPTDRAAVERAFARALRGRTEAAEVDMAYLSGTPSAAQVTFAPGQSGGAVIMTLDWSGDAA